MQQLWIYKDQPTTLAPSLNMKASSYKKENLHQIHHSIMLLQFLNFGGGGGLRFPNLPNPKNAPSAKTTPISSSPSSIRCVSQLTGNGLPAHDIAAILHNKVRLLRL